MAGDPDQNLEERLFDLARKTPAADRAAFLDRVCRGDRALRESLEQLLALHFGQAGFLPVSDEAFTSATPDHEGAKVSPPVAPPVESIGRYKLLEKLGEGGFGEVWMAEQREPIRRPVALKIIKPGMDSQQVVARFEAERQALALMDHPNIAKILDAGTTPMQSGEGRRQNPSADSALPTPHSSLAAGRPYFVMELVQGRRVTDYCDQSQLSTEDRIKLFIPVCHAVQHAHQKGVIHRDLKPSNILVTLHDGVPVPKVIDFGIAKALQPALLTDKTFLTQASQFIGTPAYISPEQADAGGGDVDTRSDIYSLGVLLYELLVGRTPFEPAEMMKGGLETLRRVIREREPVKPSTRLKTLPAEDRTVTAHRRRTEPLRLTHQLRGDLDWIVLKCLEKDRARRYQTANDLALDLQRYVAHEPVLARPPSATYQAGKWIRRHRLAFAAGSVVALALLGLLIAIAYFSVLFGREQQRTSAALRLSLTSEYLRRGQSLCLAGKVTEGLHWMVRSLEQAPADQTNLITTIRQNLGGWTAARNRPLAVMYQDALLYAAAFSPTDDRVLLGGMENSAQLYSAATGEPIGQRMRHSNVVQTAVFSPDGKLIATVDRRAWLWRAEDGRLAVPSFGPAQGVLAVAFSPDSRRLAIAATNGVAQVWSAETGQRLGLSVSHPDIVKSVAFSPNGRWIATGSRDRTARLWSAETGAPASASLRHEGPVTHVAFSPDGQALATLGQDRAVRLWAVPGGEPLAPPIRHNDAVSAIAFSPDGLRLATGTEAGIARIWDRQGEPIGSPMRNEGGVLAVAFTPDGRRVLTGGRDRTARFWSADTGEPLGQPMEHDGWVDEIHFNRDGSKILARTYGHSGAVWSAHPEAGPEIELKEQPLLAGVFSPDGRSVLTANILGEARLWSAETGEPTGLVVHHPPGIWNVAFSPDGQHFLTTGRDSHVRFWSAATGQDFGAPLVHPANVRAAAFSPDGRQVATACFDQSARVWSLATRQPLGEPFVHPKIVEDVAFSPDGTRLLTAGSDGRARVWSLATRQLALPPLEHRSAVLGVAFSPDGRRILTGSRDATARLWDAATGQPVGPPMPHPDWVEEVDFSPDGTLILTGSGDGRVWLWSAADGYLVGPPVLTHGPIMDVRFSPDGRDIIASSQARAFWTQQGPTFHGAKIWRVPEPFTGPRATAERWIEAQTGMTLDDRGVLSWLDGSIWRERMREFARAENSARRQRGK